LRVELEGKKGRKREKDREGSRTGNETKTEIGEGIRLEREKTNLESRGTRTEK